MAGYIIHLAVAEEYIRKHENEIQNYKDFIKGVIYPDSVSDKSLTHYGIKSSKVNLKNFLKENEVTTNYEKGYFVHLYTDYLFYNKFLNYFSKEIYNDYDILNKALKEKYNIKIPMEIENNIFYKEGKLKILSFDSTVKFIDMVSDYNIEEIKKEILNNKKYWHEYKKLIKL